MALFINRRDHWQITGGGELQSGDLLELQQDGDWVPCRIDYRPKRGYVLKLEDDRELEISETMHLRFQHLKEKQV